MTQIQLPKLEGMEGLIECQSTHFVGLETQLSIVFVSKFPGREIHNY